MLGPFEQAINADDKENIIRKEFTVYHKVDDKVYITKTTRRYTENDYVDSHETMVL
tara:strand:+ start:172 stop:339 length:168 start_codon:yes stop_codon:yes gene_type:complete